MDVAVTDMVNQWSHNGDIVDGETYRSIADKYHVSKSTLQRYKFVSLHSMLINSLYYF